MQFKKTLVLILATNAILALAAACGTSSSSNNSASPVYKVEYIPGTGPNAPVQGKTSFQIRITKQSDGSAATGLNPTLTVTMHMTSGDSHATPVDVVKESGTLGLYDCTVYYLMASKNNMGMSMGTWEMKVTVDGETTTFNPDVAMPMGDTPLFKLFGQNDIISTMTGTERRTYYLFKDSLIGGGTYTFNVFLATKEDMQTYPAVSAGTVLSSPTGIWSVNPATTSVQASLDSSFASYVSATDSGNGHWSLPGISGLSTGVTGTIYVKLIVNGEVKTSGTGTAAVNYATFVITPN